MIKPQHMMCYSFLFFSMYGRRIALVANKSPCPDICTMFQRILENEKWKSTTEGGVEIFAKSMRTGNYLSFLIS